MSPAIADRVFKLLQRQKVLVKVDGLLFHHEALKRLKEDVAALKRPGADARLDVATFKERFGVTRKFAIPLLEYLDRERVTRRVGDARVVLPGRDQPLWWGRANGEQPGVLHSVEHLVQEPAHPCSIGPKIESAV